MDETDYTPLGSLKGAQIKDIFLVSHSGSTYVRFVIDDPVIRYFEVGPDEVFDAEGNRFNNDLIYRP